MSKAREYLNLIESGFGLAAEVQDDTMEEHDAQYHPNGYKEGDRCKFREGKKDDGRMMKFKFLVGGVNSIREEKWVSATSFMKAIDLARMFGCNYNTKWKKNVWVKPLICDGYACRKNAIIDSDESLDSTRITQFDKFLKSDYRRKIAGRPAAEAGTSDGVHQVPVQGAESKGADGTSSETQGGSGDDGNRDHALDRNTGSEHAGRGLSGSRGGRTTYGSLSRAPEPPVRKDGTTGNVVQGEFAFDRALSPVDRYLALCANDIGIDADAQDETLVEHDKQYHPGGYNEGDSCKFRDDLKKRVENENEPKGVKCPQSEKDEVIAKYKGTDEWMKAPNGQPTKLSEKQWVQVRTPSFIKCFGDWPKEEEVTRIGSWLLTSGPVVALHGNEFGPNGEKLTDKVPRWFEQECGGVVESPEFGKVRLDREGVKDDLGHKMNRVKACAFAAVPDVIEKGKAFNRARNWKERGWDSAVIAAPIRIGKDDYICEVVIKDDGDRRGFYLHRVDYIDKFKLSLAMDPNYKKEGDKPISQNIIAELSDECKQNPCCHDVDENGEPKASNICVEDSAAKRYLAMCQEDFAARGEAQDESLEEHDRQYHPEGFKNGDTCKFRANQEKKDREDRIGSKLSADDQAALDIFKNWLPDTKFRIVDRSDMDDELKKVGDDSVMFSVSNESNKRWMKFVFQVENHSSDLQEGYVISRTPPVVAKKCFENRFGVKVADDCPFLAFSRAMVQHGYNNHGIPFAQWNGIWRKIDDPLLVTSPHDQSEGKDSLCFVLKATDRNEPTGYCNFPIAYITDQKLMDRYNHGKPYMWITTGYGIDPESFVDGRTVYYEKTQSIRQPLSTDPLSRKRAEKSPAVITHCVLTENDFQGQQLGIISNGNAPCQSATLVNGWHDKSKNEVVIASDSNIKETLAHEFGWHATLEWARTHHGELYGKLLRYASEATPEVVNAVRKTYGRMVNASFLIEEVGAARFTKECMDKINAASEKWWNKMNGGVKEVNGVYVRENAPKELSKDEVDKISAMSPGEAVNALIDAMTSGRRLGGSAQDEWVDSGDGNLAWKPRKKGKKRKPIDRVPKRRIHEIIADNVSLIKTVDKKMLPWVAKCVYKLLNGKMTPDDFIDWLMDECDLSEGRAGVIACDQVTKATERIKVEDWKMRGIKFAMWKHKDGEKDPRDYHIAKWDGKSGVRNGKPNGLDGFVFNLDKPPVIDKKTMQRGFPSTLIGCRCYLKGVKA